MPVSADEFCPLGDAGGQRMAVVAESLYLINLLLLPGIAFVALGILFMRCDRRAPPLAAAHLEQTFSASLWAGILLIVISVLIFALGGWRSPVTWTLVILYFTFCHSTLVLLGIVGLAKAMAGQCWQFPLVGRPLPLDCARLESQNRLL